MATKTGYVDYTGGTATLRVHWQETVNDAPNAKSTVSITKLELSTNGLYGGQWFGDLKIQINETDAVTLSENDGNSVYLNAGSQFYEIKRNGASITGSVSNIAHNADGSKAVNIRLKPNNYSYAGFWSYPYNTKQITTTYIDKSINLTVIPVGTLSVSAGTGVASVTVTRRGVSISHGANLYYGDNLTLGWSISTGYSVDAHTVNGTTFSQGAQTGAVTGNITVVVTAKRSVSIISTSDGTFGVAQTITVTRYISGATHTIVASCAGQTQTIVTSSSSLSVSWTPDPQIMNSIPASMNASCTLTITTFSGGATIGSYSITITLSLPNSGTYSVKPVPVITDSDSRGFKQIFGTYVAGKSVLSVDIDDGTKYSATAAQRSTSANGVTSGASSFSAGILSAGTTISTSVTDSRGQTGTASKSISVAAYTSPTISAFSVHRTDNQGNPNDLGDYFTATFTVSLTALNNNNTKSLKLRYKKVADSTYTEINYTSSLTGYSLTMTTAAIAASGDYSFDIQLYLADYFEAVTKSTKLSTAAVVESRRPTGTGVAFGKVAETDGVFDINWSLIVRGDAEFHGTKKPKVVIAEGNSGIWHFVKYSDGTAECWGTATGTTSTWTAWGSMQNSNTIPSSAPAFPFTFTSVPQVAVGFWSTLQTVGYFCNLGATASAAPTYVAMRPTAGNTGGVVSVCYYVWGRWQ